MVHRIGDLNGAMVHQLGEVQYQLIKIQLQLGPVEVSALWGRSKSEVVSHPFTQSLLPRHATSGTFAQDPARDVVRRHTQEPAEKSRQILPIRLQLLDRYAFLENAPDFGDLKRSIDPLPISPSRVVGISYGPQAMTDRSWRVARIDPGATIRKLGAAVHLDGSSVGRSPFEGLQEILYTFWIARAPPRTTSLAWRTDCWVRPSGRNHACQNHRKLSHTSYGGSHPNCRCAASPSAFEGQKRAGAFAS
jgi:hypothetical protein